MVTRVANGISYNRNTAADLYGVENDSIYILATNAHLFATWAGNDTIDGSAAIFSAFTTEIYSGLGDDHVAGTGGTDWIYDGAGNDTILAGAGDDRVHADLGNDIYYGGAGKDLIDFRYLNVRGPGFTDSYTEGLTFDLSKTTVQDLGLRGFDQFFGFEDVNGSSANDKLYGDAGANKITAADGNDYVDGRGGNDELLGEEGSDTLYGNQGIDTLNVGEAVKVRDIIRFGATSESALSLTYADKILNFDKGGLATDDKIDLSLIDANPLTAVNDAFTFIGTGALTALAGEVKLMVFGADTLVLIDTDADATQEMAILVKGVTGLTAPDFIL